MLTYVLPVEQRVMLFVILTVCNVNVCVASRAESDVVCYPDSL